MSECRQVRSIQVGDSEYVAALHLALRITVASSSMPEPEAADLLAAARAGRVRLSPAYVQADNCVAIGVLAPGAAALLLLSAAKNEAPVDVMIACLCSVVAHAKSCGCKLLEVLLDPDDSNESAWHTALQVAGFRSLSQLIYLSHQDFHASTKPIHPIHLDWVKYSASTEPLFIAALDASYVGTMDCPELTGMRTTAEVLAGHRATGEFNPDSWWVGMRGDCPAGVLLLNPLRNKTAEITYLGVAQVARRSGVADALVARALEYCRSKSVTTLALAVDQRNIPALRLYARWGFKPFQQRDAWIAAGAQVAIRTEVGNS